MSIDFKHKNILIIDDLADFRRGLKKMLESAGAKHIDDAEDGETAIKEIDLRVQNALDMKDEYIS